MAVSGGILVSLCFRASLERRPFRLISLRGFFGSLEDSWSSIRAWAISAQHRKKRSLSGGRLASFFLREVVVAVIVVVAMFAAFAPARSSDDEISQCLIVALNSYINDRLDCEDLI